MDCVRSRALLWSALLVTILLVFSVIIFSVFKKSSKEIGDYRDDVLMWVVSDYNPLEEEGFKRTTDWEEFKTHGQLSATAADFHKDEKCRRAVVFLGRGTILGHILTACDSMEPSMGLLMVEDILYYYGRAMERQGPSQDKFTLAKKIIGEHRCLVTSYTVKGDDRPKVEDKTEPKEVGGYDDEDCKILINFKMPPMLLLSTNGVTGKFTPGKSSSWATVNPWEALGAVTRLYWNGARCFRLLIITSYGRSVQAVKVSCGPVEGLVATDNALYYGDAFVVRRNPEADTFFMVYNPKRNGYCFKKTIILKYREGRLLVTIRSIGNLDEQDKECQELINGEISGATENKAEVSHLVQNLHLNNIGVEPYEASLNDYTQISEWSYFNLPMDLGFAVVYYKGKETSFIRKLLLVVAKGVPIAATLTNSGPVQRLVIRAEELYHDRDIMLKKVSKERFMALVKVDEYNCFKKSYLLKNENGKTVKQELPSGGKVTKSMDEECRDLIEGKKLKNAKVGDSVDTDEFGVPNSLPAGVNVGDPSADVKKENQSSTN